jgi:hypothetical protein
MQLHDILMVENHVAENPETPQLDAQQLIWKDFFVQQKPGNIDHVQPLYLSDKEKLTSVDLGNPLFILSVVIDTLSKKLSFNYWEPCEPEQWKCLEKLIKASWKFCFQGSTISTLLKTLNKKFILICQLHCHIDFSN